MALIQLGQREKHTSYNLITNYTKNKNPLYKSYTNTLLQRYTLLKPTHSYKKKTFTTLSLNTLTHYKGALTNFSVHTALTYTSHFCVSLTSLFELSLEFT